MTPQADPGVWAERRGTRDLSGRGALFLDRDGVINVDAGYVGRPEDVVMIEGAAELVATANALGRAVVVVTNQSGVGRGLFGWDGFAAVMEAIHAALAARGAAVDAVMACACHPEAAAPFRHPDHPMRKPRPGMILAAAEMLGIDRARSLIVGDAPRDIAAGAAAGLAGGAFLSTADPPPIAGFPVVRHPPSGGLARLRDDCAAFLSGRPSPWTPEPDGGA